MRSARDDAVRAGIPRSLRDVQRSLLPDELLAPVPPFDAYREDVARLDGHAPLAAADDAWLVVGHTLARAATLPPAARTRVLTAGSDAVASIVDELRQLERPDDAVAMRSLGDAAAAGASMRVLGGLLADDAAAIERADLDRALDGVQRVAADQERAGAFRLALTTLQALSGAADPILDGRHRGLLLAQQGRAARQLGALEAATQLYRLAARAARAGRAPEVAARALLGLGVLANMRGNYPESRTMFVQALVAARRADEAWLERAAHHGLLCAALAARDVDVALEHGWAAFAGTPDEASEERAEMLVNLANAGLLAGDDRAVLGACLHALEITDVARIRLPALGTAAAAAARLGERALLVHLARDAERMVARSGQPFENAGTLLELANAWATLGEPTAVEYAARAQAIAQFGMFHEIALRAEQIRELATADGRVADGRAVEGHIGAARVHHGVVPDGVGAIGPTRAGRASAMRTPRARAALRSMEALSAARRYAERVAS